MLPGKLKSAHASPLYNALTLRWPLSLRPGGNTSAYECTSIVSSVGVTEANQGQLERPCHILSLQLTDP